MARQNFGGFGGGGNMQQLMRQAQKMQQQLQETQEKLDAAEYEASAGGGMVSVRISGKPEVIGVTINPQVVDPRCGNAAGSDSGSGQRSPPEERGNEGSGHEPHGAWHGRPVLIS